MLSDEDGSNQQLKIVVLGDLAVGKTCLIRRYCSNDFTKQYTPTSGVDFFLKHDSIDPSRTKNLTLNLWDVSGSSRIMLYNYLFKANIIVIVFDLTNESTFHHVPMWIETIESLSLPQPITISLIGNKCDMEHQRKIRLELQSKMATEWNIASSQVVSARTGEGVAVAFQRILAAHLGVRLLKSQLEQAGAVVRAEISTYIEPQAQASIATSRIPASSSSVCVIQ